MKLSIIQRAIRKARKELRLMREAIPKIKYYVALMFRKDPVRPWSVIRYGADIAVCHFLYRANVADYFELHFYEKTHRERKTYFTEEDALRFVNHVNGVWNNQAFYNKSHMYHVLEKFTKRELLFCPPADYREFEDYLLRHRKVFYKPDRTYCGNGIELWSADRSEIPELYKRASEQTAVLDEPVTQHPDLKRLNPDCLNTVKIYTMMLQDECRFIAAELRMGRGGSFVDNIERGGLAAAVDPETGAIIGDACDLRMDPYPVHPDTGVRISGFILPTWPGVLRFTEECARACPLAYVEWDIAIRENDCVLIEANPNAKNSELQMGVFHGRKKQFQELEELYTRGGMHR